MLIRGLQRNIGAQRKMYNSHMKENKRGAGGITILFILIAVLLIAVVFSIVYTKYAQEMKNKGGILFTRTKEETSSAIKYIEISGTDGMDGHLNNFSLLLSSLPGSAELILSTCSMVVTSGSERATLDYRPNGDRELSNTGFNTWTEKDLGTLALNTWYTLEEDLDDDMIDDQIKVNSSHALINISSTQLNYSIIALDKDNHSMNISQGGRTLDNFALIEEEGRIFGYLNLSGYNQNRTVIEDQVRFIVKPKNVGKGYYSVYYVSRAGVPIENVLLNGDTIQINLQSFKNIGPDDFVAFNFICPSIIPIEKKVFTGNVIPRSTKVVLYPQI